MNIFNNRSFTKEMSARERFIAAINHDPVDYTPCSPFFNMLTPQQRVGKRYNFPWGPSQLENIDYCVKELGIDPTLTINIGGYAIESEVSTKIWFEGRILHKTYFTPSGELHASIKYTESWPHGYDIPIFSDFNVGHFVEPWIKTMQDIECLKHIIKPFKSKEFISELRNEFQMMKELSVRYGDLAIISHIGLGLTAALLAFGSEGVCTKAIDEPELIHAFIELEHTSNMYYMELAAELGVDLIRRNGFYETCDFYSPTMLESFLSKPLAEEISIVHQSGKLIGYTVNTGVMPMLDYLDKLDFDCLMHIDIAFKDTDISKIHDKLGDKKSFWIGPSSAYHIWSDDTNIVRKAVRDVFEVFGTEGLLITACPSAHSIMPWENTLAMIDEWKKLRKA